MGVFSWFDLLKIFKEAGFPDGVVNIVMRQGVTIDEAKTSQPILIRLPLQDPHQPSIIISALIFP